jgi:hypothetical protein
MPTTEQFRSDQHVVVKRRTRKGSRNDLVTHRGTAHVIGAWDMTPDGVMVTDASLVPELARAAIEQATRAGSFGRNMYDLAKLATDAYGLEPLIGGVDVAFEQMIRADRADPGANVADAARCSARRDGLSGWTSTASADLVSQDMTSTRPVTPWQLRTTVPMGVRRSGEGLPGVYGPMLDDAVGRWVPEVSRYVTRSHERRTVPVRPTFGGYWRCITHITPPSDVTYWCDTPASLALTHDTPGAAPCAAAESDRVFIGHNLVKRAPVKRRGGKRAAQVVESYNVTDATTLPDVTTLEPGQALTFRTPHYTGRLSRSASSGRWTARATGDDGTVRTLKSARTALAARVFLESVI